MSDIISLNGYKIKDEKAVRIYETVALMKSDSKLKEGYHVKTKGYYVANDGGSAEYYITSIESNTDYQEHLSNGLYATLKIENIMNPIQFGCYGDNTHDDTDLLKKCSEYCKNITLLGKTYKITDFSFTANSNIDGEGAILNCSLLGSATICKIRSNSIIKNITINSLSEDLQWSRVDMSDEENITIENCIVTGFRNPTNSNSWGLYMKNSKNIKILNCKFDNNTQSDIALTENTENVIINGCSALNSYFKINLEPRGIIKNVRLENNIVNSMTLYTVAEESYGCQNIDIIHNVIESLKLNGMTGRLIDNTINSISTSTGDNFGNIIENINSIGLDKQLNDDLYLLNIQDQNSANMYEHWVNGYSTINKLKRNIDNIKGRYLELNGENSNDVVQIQRMFNCTENEIYFIRTLMNSKNLPNQNINARGLNIDFYNENEELLSTAKELIDRAKNESTNNETIWCEKSVFIKIPEGCTHFKVRLTNGSASRDTKLTNWGYVKINKVNLSNKNIIEDNKSYSNSLPTSSLSLFGTNNANLEGDVIYLTDGSHYLGYCTESGNPGTWKTISFDD